MRLIIRFHVFHLFFATLSNSLAAAAAAASPKNFLLECDAMGGKEVMQFGKRGGGLYALDFCAPMGLLQAFGSCLVAFEWQDEEASDDES